MATPIHSRQSLADGIHSVVGFTYASSGSLAAATGFQTYDLYKLGLITADNSLWILVNTSTPTWAPVHPSGSSGGGGSALPLINNLAILAARASVNQSVFQAVAAFEFNPTGPETMAPSGSVAYSAYFQPIIQVFPTGVTCETQLFNVTTNSYITASILSSSALPSTRLRSVELSPHLATGSNIYEMHMRITNAGAGEGLCLGAKLFVTWR